MKKIVTHVFSSHPFIGKVGDVKSIWNRGYLKQRALIDEYFLVQLEWCRRATRGAQKITFRKTCYLTRLNIEEAKRLAQLLCTATRNEKSVSVLWKQQYKIFIEGPFQGKTTLPEYVKAFLRQKYPSFDVSSIGPYKGTARLHGCEIRLDDSEMLSSTKDHCAKYRLDIPISNRRPTVVLTKEDVEPPKLRMREEPFEEEEEVKDSSSDEIENLPVYAAIRNDDPILVSLFPEAVSFSLL